MKGHKKYGHKKYGLAVKSGLVKGDERNKQINCSSTVSKVFLKKLCKILPISDPKVIKKVNQKYGLAIKSGLVKGDKRTNGTNRQLFSRS